MFRARPVAGLAGDAEDQMLFVEFAVDGGSSSVTAEAAADLGVSDAPIHRLLDILGRCKIAEGCKAKIFQSFKVRDAGFIKMTVLFFEEIRLAHARCAECPQQRRRQRLSSIRNRVKSMLPVALDEVSIHADRKCEIAMGVQNLSIRRNRNGAGHRRLWLRRSLG